MKRRGVYILILCLFLISLTMISAQPPPQQNVNTVIGYDIEFSKVDILKENQNRTFSFHVFNRSNGLRLDNNSVDCGFHLFSPEGEHQFINDDLTFNETHQDWEIVLTMGNFTQGNYYVMMDCSSTNFGGFVSFPLEVTPTGLKLETSESLLYFLLAFGVFFLFLLSFYFLIITPYGNKTNDKGAVIKLTKLKYVKLALILLTWVLFTWFLNILVGISVNFISLTMYSGFFGFIFDLMNRLALPLGIVIFVMFMFEFIRDANIQKNISKFGVSEK